MNGSPLTLSGGVSYASGPDGVQGFNFAGYPQQPTFDPSPYLSGAVSAAAPIVGSVFASRAPVSYSVPVMNNSVPVQTVPTNSTFAPVQNVTETANVMTSPTIQAMHLPNNYVAPVGPLPRVSINPTPSVQIMQPDGSIQIGRHNYPAGAVTAQALGNNGMQLKRMQPMLDTMPPPPDSLSVNGRSVSPAVGDPNFIPMPQPVLSHQPMMPQGMGSISSAPPVLPPMPMGGGQSDLSDAIRYLPASVQNTGYMNPAMQQLQNDADAAKPVLFDRNGNARQVVVPRPVAPSAMPGWRGMLNRWAEASSPEVKQLNTIRYAHQVRAADEEQKRYDAYTKGLRDDRTRALEKLADRQYDADKEAFKAAWDVGKELISKKMPSAETISSAAKYVMDNTPLPGPERNAMIAGFLQNGIDLRGMAGATNPEVASEMQARAATTQATNLANQYNAATMDARIRKANADAQAAQQRADMDKAIADDLKVLKHANAQKAVMQAQVAAGAPGLKAQKANDEYNVKTARIQLQALKSTVGAANKTIADYEHLISMQGNPNIDPTVVKAQMESYGPIVQGGQYAGMPRRVAGARKFLAEEAPQRQADILSSIQRMHNLQAAAKAPDGLSDYRGAIE